MKHLKIIEQISIVLVVAVLIPFITIGIIISNVSQQSVRKELAANASLMAEFIADSTEKYIEFSQAQLNQMASGFNYIPATMSKIQYFNDIEDKTKLFKNLEVIEKVKLPNPKTKVKEDYITLYSPIDKHYYLAGDIRINIINELFKDENLRGRNIFIIDGTTKELITSNTKALQIDDELKGFDYNKKEKSGLFGDVKNTPKAYSKIHNSSWVVIVDTTKKITKNTINKARYKIILSLLLAALSIIVIVSLYSYYLYINIRQLFKAITAISKGNYAKKIHLIKNAFTPHETIFLAKEFNYMANKIDVSYRDLKKKNKELKQLNEYRENLINSTSHEFRTPLTSIIGYTSRLLRHDIVLDNETRIKSLKIIKEQAQRLSKMVEDLLVIPELDSMSMKFDIGEVDLIESVQKVMEYLNKEDIPFILDVKSNIPYVWADEYRLEQILINIMDNAQKYSLDKAPVKINIDIEENMPVLKVINKCEKITPKMKEKLFDKFIRVDSTLTRTTRGTGLGLYIVKGLAVAMNIDIDLECSDEFIMTLKFKDYVK